MHFQSLYFALFPFQSLNQLTLDIQVISVIQLTTKTDVANKCTICTVNVDVSIKIILKMLHQHPRQLPHQHLTLKNKFINFKNYKKQKNIIKNKKMVELRSVYVCAQFLFLLLPTLRLCQFLLLSFHKIKYTSFQTQI